MARSRANQVAVAATCRWSRGGGRPSRNRRWRSGGAPSAGPPRPVRPGGHWTRQCREPDPCARGRTADGLPLPVRSPRRRGAAGRSAGHLAIVVVRIAASASALAVTASGTGHRPDQAPGDPTARSVRWDPPRVRTCGLEQAGRFIGPLRGPGVTGCSPGTRSRFGIPVHTSRPYRLVGTSLCAHLPPNTETRDSPHQAEQLSRLAAPQDVHCPHPPHRALGPNPGAAA